MNKFKELMADTVRFLAKERKYVVSSVLLIITVLVMVSSSDDKIRMFPAFKKKSPVVKEEEILPPEAENEQEEEGNPLILNEDKELNKFIKKYYKALENADIEKIRKYVDVLNDIEVNSIRQKAKAREAHKNIKVYTKKGPEEDSYLAYVYLDLKFKNIKTTAPGIEPFYIKKESDGYVIINSMNSSAEDLQFTNEMESAEDVVELFAKTDEAYREACSKDKELVKMLKENGFEVPELNKEKEEKNDEPKTEENKNLSSTKEGSNETGSSSEQAETTQTKTEKPKKSKSIVGNIYELKDGIRLREKKSTKSQVKASGIKEDRVKVLKEYENSSWVKVELIAAGKKFKGFMKKDVLLENSKLKK